MVWMKFFGTLLTALFFAGVAGSCIVIVLFVADMLRTIIHEEKSAPTR